MTDGVTSPKVLRRRRSRDIRVTTAFRHALALLSPGERRRLWLLVPVLTLNALLQVLGIASVMPFLSLAANPASIQEQVYLAWAYDALGFQSALSFTIAAGVAVLLMLTLTNAFAALTDYGLLRFAWGLNHALAVRLLRAYLFKPYSFFLDHNSAALAQNILGEVRHAVSHFVVAGMQLVSSVFVALAIIILVIAIEPVLSLATFGFLAGAYSLVFTVLRRRISELGDARANADSGRFRAAAEALAGVKAIKLLGKERPFLRRFELPSRVYSRSITQQQVFAILPRYVMESVALGAMLVIVLVYLSRGQGIADLLPTLGVYVFASYRLLPKLQAVFSTMTALRFSTASIELLYDDLVDDTPTLTSQAKNAAPLPFRQSLELRDMTFTYPNAPSAVLDHFDVRITPNTSVAFVGTTGSGKSTVVDILLGLLRPECGGLVVDGMHVEDADLRSWQANLGYVPQEIYLADDTVAANIAFGESADAIDRDRVERAARHASIHDFIVGELPQGYDTEIGERGVRLSGGQRQRLGIARALYRDPPVLVLDEATSALDSVTESSIFEAVRALGRSKTIIMVAHRISTIRDCDVIYLLDRGKIVASGSFDDLLRVSPEFRKLAKSGDDATVEASP